MEMHVSHDEEAPFEESQFISEKMASYMTENFDAHRAKFLDYIQPVFFGRFSGI